MFFYKFSWNILSWDISPNLFFFFLSKSDSWAADDELPRLRLECDPVDVVAVSLQQLHVHLDENRLLKEKYLVFIHSEPTNIDVKWPMAQLHNLALYTICWTPIVIFYIYMERSPHLILYIDCTMYINNIVNT